MHPIPTPSGAINSGYLLIEASNVNDETFADRLPMQRCTPHMLTKSSELMPCLIDVAALSASQRTDLGEVLTRELNGERPPIVCAWLECDLDVETLARHITRYLVGPDIEGALVLWRFFDPRVFSLAMQIFSPEQAQALLGPVIAWRFPWCHQWWSIEGTGHTADPILGITPAWPTEGQWQRLVDSALIWSVMERIHDLKMAQGSQDAEAVKLQQRSISLAMFDAKTRFKLSEKDDLIEFALNKERYGYQFRDHPKLTHAWFELASARLTWSQLVAMLDQNDLRLFDAKF